MNRVGYWFRWFAVLPGAFLAGLVALFLLHFSLYVTLRNFVDPYPALPERVLTPPAFGLAFVWGGSRIAPKHPLATAVGLFGIEIVLLVGIAFLSLSGGTWVGRWLQLQGNGIAPATGAVGALIGLWVVRRGAAAVQAAPLPRQ